MDSRSIFALSVSPGRSALHVTRLSGEDLFDRATSLFLNSPKVTRFMSQSNSMQRALFYERIWDDQGSLIDDVVVSLFRGPHSYTGEDTIEISGHGNPLITAKLHRALRTLGIRDAAPGEFTQRAYLNGKKDLAQAEAIHQLITAESENGLELARAVAEGKLTSEIQELKAALLGALAYLEAHIDFEESDVGTFESSGLLAPLNFVNARLQKLADSYESGKKIRSGLVTVLSGLPNAGKSTLFNSMLQSDRAIVTEIAGTTRDYLEERLSIEGRDFVLVDTAGLRETNDLVEKIGVERSLLRVKEADILIYAIDGQSTQDEITSELDKLSSFLNDSTLKDVIFAITKVDLISDAQCTSVQKILDHYHTRYLGHEMALKTECVFVKPDDGLKIFTSLKRIYDAWGLKEMATKEPVLIAARQKDRVVAARLSVHQTLKLIEDKDYPEKMASCLQLASYELASILGQITVEEVLGEVFSNFCIGK